MHKRFWLRSVRSGKPETVRDYRCGHKPRKLSGEHAMLSRIIVFSRHPLALQVVAEALTSDPALAIEAEVVGTLEKPHLDYPGQLLLLDSCLQPQWLEGAVEWYKSGGYVLILYD